MRQPLAAKFPTRCNSSFPTRCNSSALRHDAMQKQRYKSHPVPATLRNRTILAGREQKKAPAEQSNTPIQYP